MIDVAEEVIKQENDKGSLMKEMIESVEERNFDGMIGSMDCLY